MKRRFYTGSPEAFMKQLEDRIDELSDVDSCETIETEVEGATNTVDIPIGYETVEADEDEISAHERYVHILMGEVQEELFKEVDALNQIEFDDNEISFVVTHNGESAEYHVPFSDLSQDFDKIDEDVMYICEEIRSSFTNEPVTSAENVDGWILLDTKSVLDYDGFWTEYTLWTDGLRFVCILDRKSVV